MPSSRYSRLAKDSPFSHTVKLFNLGNCYVAYLWFCFLSPFSLSDHRGIISNHLFSLHHFQLFYILSLFHLWTCSYFFNFNRGGWRWFLHWDKVTFLVKLFFVILFLFFLSGTLTGLQPYMDFLMARFSFCYRMCSTKCHIEDIELSWFFYNSLLPSIR